MAFARDRATEVLLIGSVRLDGDLQLKPEGESKPDNIVSGAFWVSIACHECEDCA